MMEIMLGNSWKNLRNPWSVYTTTITRIKVYVDYIFLKNGKVLKPITTSIEKTI